MPQMVYSEHKWCFKSRQPARLMAWLEVRPAPRNGLWQQCPMHGAGAAEPGQSALWRICTSRWIEWGRSRSATDRALPTNQELHCSHRAVLGLHGLSRRVSLPSLGYGLGFSFLGSAIHPSHDVWRGKDCRKYPEFGKASQVPMRRGGVRLPELRWISPGSPVSMAVSWVSSPLMDRQTDVQTLPLVQTCITVG